MPDTFSPSLNTPPLNLSAPHSTRYPDGAAPASCRSQRTPDTWTSQRRYNRSPRGITVRRAAQARYALTEKGQANIARKLAKRRAKRLAARLAGAVS